MLLWTSACDWGLSHGARVKYLNMLTSRGHGLRKHRRLEGVCVHVHNEGQNICSTSVTFQWVPQSKEEHETMLQQYTGKRQTANKLAEAALEGVWKRVRDTEKSTPMCYNHVICSLGVMLRWWYDSPRQETCFWPSSGWDLRGSGEIRYHFIQLLFLKLTGKNKGTHFCWLCYW